MLGTIFIYTAVIASIGSAIAYFLKGADGPSRLVLARIGVWASAASVLAASVLLMTAILSHDFSYSYVFGYSSRDLAFHFLLSSFYAGQEGSFLFWTLCSALLSVALLASVKNKQTEAPVMIVFLATQLFLLILLATKSPFESIWDAFPGQLAAGQLPQDGKGLNPLLQNFWMVIHPPVLFIGFALTAVPFSFAIAGLWKENYSQWIVNALPWTIAAAVLLGLGIMLGAYWAYGILGWGGYWGWDPVENASLIPWLLLMAVIHTMLIQLRTQKLPRTNFALAIASYVLVVYSTFLTRSGVLGDSSVHSFTDPGRLVYMLLLGFVIAFALLGFGLLLFRNRELSSEGKPMAYMSREFVLFAGSFLLLIIAAVVFFGTNVPLFSELRVEPSFYDTTTLPFAAVMTLFIGLSLMIRWGADEFSIVGEKSLKAFILGAVLTAVVAFAMNISNALALLLVFASVYTIAVNIEIAFMTMQGNWRMMGGKIAHIGLGLFFLGVIFNGLLKDKQTFSLPLNTQVQVFDHKATFTGFRTVDGNKTAFDVKVEKDGETFVLSPVMFETESSGLMRTPDLHSYLTRDFYISPVTVEAAESGDPSVGESVVLTKGKTGTLGGATVRFVRFEMDSHAMGSPNGATVGTLLEITKDGKTEQVVPAISYGSNAAPQYKAAHSHTFEADIRLVEMRIGQGGEESKITVALAGGGGTKQTTDTLIIEASLHPYIMLLWIGTVLLFLGMIIAYARRKSEDAQLSL